MMMMKKKRLIKLQTAKLIVNINDPTVASLAALAVLTLKRVVKGTNH